MPYEFFYKQGDKEYVVPMLTMRCQAINADDHQQCERKTAIGLPFCWTHLETNMHLKITEMGPRTTEPHYYEGRFRNHKGVIAYNRAQKGIIFRAGDKICEYRGERITPEEKIHRYGEQGGPSGGVIYRNQYESVLIMAPLFSYSIGFFS